MDYAKYMISKEKQNEAQLPLARDVLNSFLKDCDRILDVGCGTGWFLWACREAARKGVGLDYDAKLVSHCRKKGYEVVCASSAKMPFKTNSFDGVFSFSLLEHLASEDLFSTVKEIRRVLKPGGKAFIETPNLMGAGFHYWDDPTHRTVFTKTMAEKLFNDFSEVTVVEERYVPKVKGFFNAARIPFAYRLIARAVPEGLMKPTNRLYCKLIK